MFLQISNTLLIMTILQSCNINPNSGNSNDKHLFDEPIKSISLPPELNEISGITWYSENFLLGHHDESASLFLINLSDGKVEKSMEPNIAGDFEDIALSHDKIYMLKSNGNIYEFDRNDTLSTTPVIYKTRLTEKNDTEGMAFDKKSNALLIACKNKAGIKKADVGINVRAVYRFDLETKKLIDEPYLTIDQDDLRDQYRLEKFMPSAIAIHPSNGSIYLLSGVGKALLVFNHENQLLNAYKLKSSLFQQPEGICFHPNGKFVYISNEGKGRKANILVFKIE
jgi:uncharacterized protein YjiK